MAAVSWGTLIVSLYIGNGVLASVSCTQHRKAFIRAKEDVLDASVTNKDDDSSTTTKRCRDSLWKGQYCCVPLCHHSSGESVERKLLNSGRISFHSFPNLSTDRERALKWIVKIRRDPRTSFVINKNTKICSEHFKLEDFLCGGGNPQAARHTLKKTAVPSLFPWASVNKEYTTTTSQKAALELECDLSSSEEDSVSPELSLNKFCEMDAEDIDYNSTEYLQVTELLNQLAEVQAKYEKSLFRLANIKEDNDLVPFYAGFPDYDTFFCFTKSFWNPMQKL